MSLAPVHAPPSPVALGRPARLVDTTMLYAPHSGGVKRYLEAKRAWIRAERPTVRHSLVLPGKHEGHDGEGVFSISTAPLPFGNGYRWPLSKAAWTDRLVRRRPTLIEAADPYTPGQAALRAGQMVGVPVVGFCHTDLPALAALHLGEWSEATVRRRWAKVYGQFDAVLAPSRFIAGRLQEAGVRHAQAMPLGVDTVVFTPERADRAAVRADLGVAPHQKLLIFAGRPAREKRIDVLVEAAERLGPDYVLLLVGAGEAAPASDRVIARPYVADTGRLARLIASADAFVHANPDEPLGLVVLEALACGAPVVGVASGGIGETVDETVGQLASRAEAGAFAEAVAALFARDVAAVGAAARARAVERHSWPAVFDDLMYVYADLTGDAAFLSETKLA